MTDQIINPYKDFENTQNYIIRTFDEDVHPHELVWHRDREDRLVEVLGQTNWKVQLDNELPQTLDQVFIPKNVYHRLIKGTGSLTVKIHKK
jgi:hypothetical protein